MNFEVDPPTEEQAKVISGEWEFITPCDHGSHMWCCACMNAFYVEGQHNDCALCAPEPELPEEYGGEA